MASIIQPPVRFTSNAASDLLRSSSSGFSGIPLKALGRARLGMRRRDFSVTAKLRKVEKHEYPWPDDADPNVKGGVLSHLSHFKPLKEKPKPVQLDFEKPLIELEKKINDVRKMADETGLDFSNQINSLENKYYQALENLYKHLTPIQRVNIARHPNRPTFLDHVFSITDKFVELHGDREGYDDPAIVTGIGTIDGERYMFIGHQKGRNTKENIKRNFGMPTPHGYRKALRMMYYADHHQFPIITFVDTPGAFADLKSEELGQGEAIAHNLRTMFGLKVPIVSIVIGEGGSGGALAIACANKLLMLENAVFYVASPEACAAILWKSAKAAPKAAEKLRITATELYKLQIADGIIPEPLGGAHADPSWTSQQIKAAVVESMNELKKMKTEELLKHRMLKFRKIGGFQEGIPIDPERKRNMKKKEKPLDSKKEKPLVSKKKIPLKRKKNLKGEIEKLKQQILKAKESSTEVPEPVIDGMIVKLKKEVIREHFEAAKSMGLSERVKKLREEISGANSGDQNMQALLMEKIDQLKHDFNQGLSTAPNYARLKYKVDMLNDLSRIKFNKKFEEVLHRPDIKEKTEALQAEISRSGAATVEDVEPELKEKILKTKKEIEAEVANALGLNVLKPEKDISKLIAVPEIKAKVEHLNEKISKKIEDVVSSTDLKNMIAALKFQVTKAGTSPDLASKNKIEALEQQIRMKLSEAVNSSELKEEHEELREILKVTESSPGSGNGSVIGDNSGSADSRVGVNVGGYA